MKSGFGTRQIQQFRDEAHTVTMVASKLSNEYVKF